MDTNILLIGALERAFAGTTVPIPPKDMRLPKKSSEKDSVFVGSIADEPLLRALFYERRKIMGILDAIKLGADSNMAAAVMDSVRLKNEVYEPLSNIMWAGIRRRFPELNGHSIEILDGMMICKFPPKQVEMNPLAAIAAILGGNIHR